MALNKIIEIGRLTADTEVRYATGNAPLAIGRFTIAVERPKKAGEEGVTDFIPCVVFGSRAEFCEKHFRKGTKVYISGRLQTYKYTNKDGVKMTGFEINVEECGFVEGKNSSAAKEPTPGGAEAARTGFLNIPDGLDDISDIPELFK